MPGHKCNVDKMSPNKYVSTGTIRSITSESRLSRSLSSARPKLDDIKRHSLSRSSDDLSEKPSVKISTIIGKSLILFDSSKVNYLHQI